MHNKRIFSQAATTILLMALIGWGELTPAAGEEPALALDDEIIISDEDGGEYLIIEDEGTEKFTGTGDEDTGSDESPVIDEEVTDERESLVIEEDVTDEEESLVIEDDITDEEESLVIEDDITDEGESLVIEDDKNAPPAARPGSDEAGEVPGTRVVAESGPASPFSLNIDKVWAEYGRFVDSDSQADNQGYFHTLISATWNPEGKWDAKLSGRVDSYQQWGGRDWNRTELDYDESFIRYRDENYRVTLGAQKVMWGRLDEVSPTDRLSVRDLSRGVLDYLPERRRAAPVGRFEGFLGDYKLDAVLLPYFRKAKLPGQKGAWYPINKKKGTVLGLKSSPLMKTIVKSANINTDAPDTYAGYGLRLSGTEGMLDYALTVQRVRQSDPYFRYSPGSASLEAEYPRSWVYGGDLGLAALGGTLRFEAAWISNTPVTRSGGRYDTTGSINWGTGYEFYPGDSDARVTLQLISTNLVGISNVVDRQNIYTFHSEASIPFLHDRWRFKNRLFLGLDQQDVYINPEIAFIDWEPHELYLSAHYFAGDNGTIGGFYKDNSMVTLGWRAEF